MNKKVLRKITAITMSALMFVSLFAPVSAFAEAEDENGQTVLEEVQTDNVNAEELVEGEQELALELDENQGEPTPVDETKPQDETKPAEGSKEMAELQIKLVATPLNPATKVYKNGKVGKFTVIYSGEWGIITDEDISEDEALVEENKEKAKAAVEALIADGWKFKYDLQDGNGKAIAENIDLEEGFSYVIPAKNTGVKVVATASKEGEEPVVFESEVSEKIVWTKAPTKVKATVAKGSNNVKVTWSKVEDASGYYVYRIASKKKTPKTPIAYVTKEKGRKYIDENLPGKKTYYYYVKSVYLGKVAGKSYHTSSEMTTKKVKATVQKYLTCNVRPIGWHTTTKDAATLFNGKTGGASHGTVKKGTRVNVTEKYPAKVKYGSTPSRIRINYKKNGKTVTGWIGYSHAKGGVDGTVAFSNHKAYDWTEEKKEKFINNKDLTSATKYLIWVSTYTQRVNIFKRSGGEWKLFKSNRCVSGTFLHLTKTGTGFKIWKRKKTRVRNFYNSTGQYYYHNLSYFSKGNSFHTVCWRVGNNKQVNFIKKNLQPGTRGCCRMYTPDATWIYNNIPMNTRVIVY